MYLMYFFNIDILVLNIDILLLINIYILLKTVDVLNIFLDIDILVLNIDILLLINIDILNNDILSSYWKRGKYNIFILFSYPNRDIETNGGWVGLLWWVVSDGVGPQGRGPPDLLGGVGCTIRILMGAGVVDGSGSERCLSGGSWVIEKSLLQQLKGGAGKGINCS